MSHQASRSSTLHRVGTSRASLQSLTDGVWEWGVTTNRLFCSTAALVLLGYDPNLPPTALTFADQLHPEDQEKFARILRAHLRDGRPFDVELRWRRSQGDRVLLRTYGGVVLDDEGVALTVGGTLAPAFWDDARENSGSEDSLEPRPSTRLLPSQGAHPAPPITKAHSMTQALTYALETPDTNAPLSARQGLWAAAMLASAEELASVALGQAECSVELVSGPVSTNHVGSYLALVGANQAHQLAVLADRAGCTALAKALLGMTEDEDLPMGDVGDGMCEIANILAGGVKRRLVDSERLELGLPIFVDGRVEAKDQIETLILRLTVCSVQATIAMMSKRTDSGAAR